MPNAKAKKKLERRQRTARETIPSAIEGVEKPLRRIVMPPGPSRFKRHELLTECEKLFEDGLKAAEDPVGVLARAEPIAARVRAVGLGEDKAISMALGLPFELCASARLTQGRSAELANDPARREELGAAVVRDATEALKLYGVPEPAAAAATDSRQNWKALRQQFRLAMAGMLGVRGEAYLHLLGSIEDALVDFKAARALHNLIVEANTGCEKEHKFSYCRRGSASHLAETLARTKVGVKRPHYSREERNRLCKEFRFFEFGHDAYVCAGCGKKPTPFSGLLKQCSRCRNAWFCSRDCQRAAFAKHNPSCKGRRLWMYIGVDDKDEVKARIHANGYVHYYAADSGAIAVFYDPDAEVYFDSLSDYNIEIIQSATAKRVLRTNEPNISPGWQLYHGKASNFKDPPPGAPPEHGAPPPHGEDPAAAGATPAPAPTPTAPASSPPPPPPPPRAAPPAPAGEAGASRGHGAADDDDQQAAAAAAPPSEPDDATATA